MSSSLPSHLPPHPSGIYGPGAYTAWLLSLLTSWLSLLSGNHAAQHTIPSAIYTTWAAIDLIRHTGDALTPDNAHLTALTTPLAVLYISTLHTFLQLLISLASSTPAAQRRTLLLLASSVLPSTALFVFTSSMNSSRIAWTHSFLGSVFPTQSAIATAGVCLAIASLYAVTDMLASGLLAQFDGWAGYGAIYYVFVCVEWSVLVLGLGTWLVGRGYGAGEGRCWAVPCSVVDWAEWDQMCALGGAVWWFGYEFGSRAVGWMRRGKR